MSFNLELPHYTQDQMSELLKKQKEFYFRLKYLEDNIQTAKKLNLKECKKCGLCCWRNPCDLNKQDMINISKYLNKTVKELFEEKIVISYYAQLKKYIIIPVRKGLQAGILNPPENWFYLQQPCIFLENNLCTINPVKPKCGKEQECWTDKTDTDIGVFYSKDELLEILKEFNIC